MEETISMNIISFCLGNVLQILRIPNNAPSHKTIPEKNYDIGTMGNGKHKTRGSS